MRIRASLSVLGLTAVFLAGCETLPPPGDLATSPADLAVDLRIPPEADLATPDLAAPDLSVQLDQALPVDLALPDLTTVDLFMFSCAPNGFSCQGSFAHYCNSAGTAETVFDCGGACTGSSDCGQCTPSTVSCGDSTHLSTCDAQGRVTQTTCAFGCSATGTAHCANLVPSNSYPINCVAPSGTLDVHVTTGTMVFDPDTGNIDGIVAPAGVYDGVIKVFHVKSLVIDAGATLKGLGGAVAPLVIVVDAAVQINGTIDVAGHLINSNTMSMPGPGVDVAGVGGNGLSAASVGTGAAGGSFGSKGADGARTSGSAGLAKTPYPISADPTSLIPLQGGSAGGKGGGSTSNPAAAGGGAIQLVSCVSVTVSVTGLVNAGGAGAGKSIATAYGGGGGGGSGGGILVEAPTITVGGVLAAAGASGAGGGIGGTALLQGSPGGDAPTTLACVQTGGAGAIAAGGSLGGTGGIGACGASAPSSGTTGTIGAVTADAVGHGGGGGGGGRIRLNGTTLTVTPATSISPNTAACYATGTITTQ